jgi:dipeptidyl aminopeptidase/acylaminoacyl peptidase
VARAGQRLSQPQLDAGRVLWLERRPEERGRQVVAAAGAAGVRDATPDGVDVRSRVHEYGGGDYLAAGGEVYFVDAVRPGVFRSGAGEAIPGSGIPGSRHADFDRSPDGRWLAAVEEWHPGDGRPPENRVVLFDLRGGGRRVACEGRDFYAAPRFAPDGARLAWLAWDHPDMPWDAAALFVAPLATGGPGPGRRVAGGPGESVFQPEFSPAGHLTFVSDRSGFWNLYQERDGRVVALCPFPADFGRPLWTLGMRTYAFLGEERLVCVRTQEGVDRLARLDLPGGRLEDLALPYADVRDVRSDGRSVVFVGAARDAPAALCRLDAADGRVRELRGAFALDLPPGLVAPPEPVRFPSTDGRESHAFLYRPRHPELAGPPGERPPLLVLCHGGPTGAASPALAPGVQFWTSRGFAVLDVNYAGSTGFGRAYRDALRGLWGVADVDDCDAGARFAAAAGVADAGRCAIAGWSAGGFTALCALTFRDAFAAGASHYGIGDLEALARETHKFESRYLERLVGPWPARRDLYRARSPLHHAARLARPVIFFQGEDDAVVPPAQARAMAAALAQRGVPHACVVFPGEGHGFRREETLRRVLESELSFYARVLGFAAADAAPLALAGPP